MDLGGQRFLVKKGVLALLILTVFLPMRCDAQNEGHLAEKWLAAVAADDIQGAIAFANQLIPNAEKGEVGEKFLEIAQLHGIGKEYFYKPFDVWDFQLWRHSYLLKTIAEKLTKGNPNDIQLLFHQVVHHFELDQKNNPRVSWPYNIWKSGFADCSMIAWVFSELAYQSGFEIQLIYIQSQKQNSSIHTFCEIRKSPNSVWIADPYFNVFLPQESLDSISENQDLLRAIWPKRDDFYDCMKKSILLTPSYPQDYCPRNQKLYHHLSKSLKGRCPRFGCNPNTRVVHYQRLRARDKHFKREFFMGFWPYPFQLLKYYMDLFQSQMKEMK